MNIREYDNLSVSYLCDMFVTALCDTCFVIRLEDEQKALLDYDRAKVFVRYTSPPTQLQSAEDGDSSDNGVSIVLTSFKH